VSRVTSDDSTSIGWTFATPEKTERRSRDNGFTDAHAELHDDLRTVVLGGHLDRRARAGHDAFVAAVADAMVEPVVDYVRRSSRAVCNLGRLRSRSRAPLTGGVTEFLRIGVLADVHPMPIGPHFLPELHVHLTAAARTSSWAENFPLTALLRQLVGRGSRRGRTSRRHRPR
jgi:hypothetical protein